jgi:hypothetical protein
MKTARIAFPALLALALYPAPAQSQSVPTVAVDIPIATYSAFQSGTLAENGQLILVISVPTLRRVVLAPEDVADASLRISLSYTPVSGSIAVYRAVRIPSQNMTKSDFEPKPFAIVPFSSFRVDPYYPRGPKFVHIAGFGDAVRKSLVDAASGLPLLLVMQGVSPGQAASLSFGSTVMSVKIVSHPKAALFVPPLQPRKDVYVRNRDGHLFYGEQRLRLWGCVRPQEPNIETADRIANMGFNAIRMWGPRTTETSGPLIDDKTGEFLSASRGDGSQLDEYDRFFAEAKKDGLFIMATGLTDIAHASEKSVWLKGDGRDWPEWQKAMSSRPDSWIINFMAAVDDRLLRARKQQVKDYLTHVNPYTGRDYAHEEAIAIYELANENAHVKRTLEKGFEKWPPFFVHELQRRWNQWLIRRYHDDAGLAVAWAKLDHGESLSDGTIKLEPVVFDQAAYGKPRASDFVRFLIELDSGLNKQVEEFARSFAPKNVGVAVIPFSYDTQYQSSNAWLFDNTQNGEVANFGMYFWSLQNPLNKPPGMYVMDSSTVQGKITAIYETMDGRPDPYRAAYPYRLAALASWQDWDAIFFHYWDGFMKKGRTFSDEDYLAGSLSYISPSHYWTAVYYEKDPALLSSMAIAGQMFIRGAISPAPHPLTYVLGAKSIFSLDALGGADLARATYSQGARILFRPDSDSGTSIMGAASPSIDTKPTEAVAMGEQLLWDWQNSRLIIDTPTAKAYVGAPHGNYRFHDGTVVGGFEGSFVAFGMSSMDGKPIIGRDASRKLYLTAVNDAKNTGYKIRFNEASDPMPAGGPLGIGKLIESNGTAPVLVDPVPYKVWFPTDLTGTFEGFDLARRQRFSKIVTGGRLEYDKRDLYLASLSIRSPGTHAIATPQTDIVAPASSRQTAPASAPAAPLPHTPRTELAMIWNPLPGVRWSDDILATAAHLREAGLQIEPVVPNAEQLRLADTTVLFHSACDVDILFRAGAMSSINAVFKQPPPLSVVVAEYDKQLGLAIDKHIASSEDQISTIVWKNTYGKLSLTVTVTETQGTLSVGYTIDF